MPSGTIDSRYHPLIYALASLVLLGLFMAAYSDLRIRQFREEQLSLISESTTRVASEIHTYLQELRHTISVFTAEDADLIERAASNPAPGNESHAALEGKVRKFFPNALTFSVTDATGAVLIDDFDGMIGEMCQEEVRAFAAGETDGGVLIHPMAGSYHFDMLVPRPGSAGVFFISFRPTALMRILHSASLPGRELYLVRGDEPYLIELSPQGTRDQLGSGASFYLPFDDNAPIRVSAVIPGTHWSVAGLFDQERLKEEALSVWRQAVFVYLLVVVVVGFLTWLLMRQQGLRRKTEDSLQVIAEGIGGATGSAFFPNVTESLTEGLGVRYALVGQLVSGQAQCIETLGVWDRLRGRQDDLTYALEGTPCQRALTTGACSYPEQVSRLFPEDEILQRLNVEAYIGVPLHDSQNQPLGLLAIMHDEPLERAAERQAIVEILATRASAELERLRMQQALVSSEAKYRHLVETSRDLVWALDCEGRWTYLNQAAVRILGYEPQELIGLPFGDLVVEEQPDQSLGLLERALEGEELQDVEVEYRRKDGERGHLLVNCTPQRDEAGRIIGATGTATDISELVKAQTAARNNSELFSSVLANLPVFFFRIDKDATIADIRGHGLGRMGPANGELTGSSLFELFPTREEQIKKALAGETVLFETQGVHRGRQWWFAISMFYDAWRAGGAVGFAVDISDRKLAEERILGLLRENRALARHLLEVQEEERNKLSRELHDELGQSITAVKSLATAISHMDEGKVGEMRSLGHSIVDLSGRLYDFAKNLMHQLRPDVVDLLGLEEALRECIERSQLETTGVTCGLHTSGEIDDLSEVVKITTYRIVQECLTNISKYAMASNVQIRVRRAAVPVEERRSVTRLRFDGGGGDLKQHGLYRDTLFINVSDDGVGMDIRAVVDTEDKYSRGIGLQGIKERVTALGGQLTINSESGKGVDLSVVIDMGTYEHTDAMDAGEQTTSHNRTGDSEQKKDIVSR